jgi:hypothetical protein
MVKAYDAAANTKSASITVNLKNTDVTAPSIAISSPLSGAMVSGTVLVKGTASDNVGVSKIEFYVDGGLYATSTTAAFSFSWSTAGKANGLHTLSVKAYDAAANTKSASITVTIKNTDVTPPSITISSPLSGVSVAGSILIKGTASDNVGVTKVYFYVNGMLYSTVSSSPFTFLWTTLGKANGSYTLMVKAFDAAGNTRSASITVIVNQ